MFAFSDVHSLVDLLRMTMLKDLPAGPAENSGRTPTYYLVIGLNDIISVLGTMFALSNAHSLVDLLRMTMLKDLPPWPA